MVKKADRSVEVGRILARHEGQRVRHETFSGMNSWFGYVHVDSGIRFDVRDIPAWMQGQHRGAVDRGEVPAHKAVIKRAMELGLDFRRLG